jgi:hypothetical protein
VKILVPVLLALVSMTFAAGPSLADDLFIYPSQGQGQEKMEQDKYQCYNWAKGQTGFDPMEVPKATSPPPPQQAPQSGQVFRGAARGALRGAAIGEITNDDPGKGAAIGATTGALFGGMRKQKQAQQQQQAQQQWEQEQATQYAQKRNNYNRAYAVCLEGRGYTVK